MQPIQQRDDQPCNNLCALLRQAIDARWVQAMHRDGAVAAALVTIYFSASLGECTLAKQARTLWQISNVITPVFLLARLCIRLRCSREFYTTYPPRVEEGLLFISAGLVTLMTYDTKDPLKYSRLLSWMVLTLFSVLPIILDMVAKLRRLTPPAPALAAADPAPAPAADPAPAAADVEACATRGVMQPNGSIPDDRTRPAEPFEKPRCLMCFN